MRSSVERRGKTTQRLAEYVANAGGGPLDSLSRERARGALLDLCGIALRAVHDVPASSVVMDVVEALGIQSGPCTVFGRPGGFTPTTAALLNGVNFHALDFDDTHEATSLHPGAPVVAAALAEAQALDASVDRLLSAIVVGYDVAVRIGLALDPVPTYARGFHPTAIAGIFGATAAIASLYASPADVVVSAFGLNLSQAAGSLQFSVGAAESKPLQVGLAAHNAVLAMRLARAGFRGPDEALEGRSGLLHAYSGDGRSELILEAWDGVHEITRTAFKPYPCCRYMHAAIDLIAAMTRSHGLSADRIERIQVGLPTAGIRLCAEPEAAKRRPQLVADAQFSMYYAAAATALWGTVRWSDYRRMDAPAIHALIDRVEVTVDPRVEALVPHMAASVAIDAGEIHLHRIAESPRGEPEDPLTWAELDAKFRDLTDGLLTAPAQNATVQAIRSADGAAPISLLFSSLERGSDVRTWNA